MSSSSIWTTPVVIYAVSLLIRYVNGVALTVLEEKIVRIVMQVLTTVWGWLQSAWRWFTGLWRKDGDRGDTGSGRVIYAEFGGSHGDGAYSRSRTR